jgi:hypothetical protein
MRLLQVYCHGDQSNLTAASKPPCLKLGDVEKIIADSRTRELPIRTPPLVDDRLVSLTTKKWGPIAEGCFEKVNEQLFQTVMELRKSYFVEFPALYEKVAYVLIKILLMQVLFSHQC